jgi:hypothetical protein
VKDRFAAGSPVPGGVRAMLFAPSVFTARARMSKRPPAPIAAPAAPPSTITLAVGAEEAADAEEGAEGRDLGGERLRTAPRGVERRAGPDRDERVAREHHRGEEAELAPGCRSG